MQKSQPIKLLHASGPARPDAVRSLALAERLEMRPLQAHCHAAMGAAAKALGRPPEAHVSLDRSLRLYEELGMKRYQERVRSVLEGGNGKPEA